MWYDYLVFLREKRFSQKNIIKNSYQNKHTQTFLILSFSYHIIITVKIKKFPPLSISCELSPEFIYYIFIATTFRTLMKLLLKIPHRNPKQLNQERLSFHFCFPLTS